MGGCTSTSKTNVLGSDLEFTASSNITLEDLQKAVVSFSKRKTVSLQESVESKTRLENMGAIIEYRKTNPAQVVPRPNENDINATASPEKAVTIPETVVEEEQKD
jgi:hypothetical protein